MIIQCKACKTRYRFDETVITDDGVWVRCSRCQHVFFQASGPGEPTIRKGDVIPEPAVDKMPDRELVTGDAEEPAVPDEPVKKSSLTAWVLGLVLIILIFAGGAFYIYPPIGEVVIKQITAIFPAASGFLQGDAGVPAVGPAQVRIVDLKQRFVENAVMGNIRVVEGMAVNGASEPMTRIKVRAELYDALGTPIRQSVSYCGNLLTDQELKTVMEEQIVRKLSVPQGTDISNDRVPPKGMIPFMIIFLREPPGVTKTLVTPIEAERLLP